MKTTKRRQRLIGNLLFFVPMILIGSLVLYAFISLSAPGTLSVSSLGHDRYVPSLASSQGTTILAGFTVVDSAGKNVDTGTTPTSLSLSSGLYTVVFAPQRWYTTPSDDTVQVSSQMTVYSVGVYQVVPSVIAVTQTGFNSTKVSALHGVTPVIWINTSGSMLLLRLSSGGTVPLQAGQNYTKIFQQAGPITFSLASNQTGTLEVD